METDNQRIAAAVAAQTSLALRGVQAVIELLDEGATVPFISRYRKERTGSLDEVSVRLIEKTLAKVRELEARKEFVVKAITEAGAMTDRIRESISNAATMTELEDIYAPFKPKRRTRAAMAREKGLEPLAKMIMGGNSDCDRIASGFVGKNGVSSAEEAINGASDIIAEWASESIRLRNITRNTMRRSGRIVTTVAKGKESELAGTSLAQYGDFTQSVRRMQSHQYLALRRAEREGLVKVRYEIETPEEDLTEALERAFIPQRASGRGRQIIKGAVKDAYKRLLRTSVENEICGDMKEEADRVAIDIFSGNLRQLLLAPPLKGHRVLAIDPGYRTGCKTVVLDQQGNLLAEDVIFPTQPRNDIAGATSVLSRIIERYRPDVAAIGNGTASRETERFLKQSGLLRPDSIFMVNEDGASVYSASEIARKEFPDKDVTVRGAVSIGRRLIDPLAELVKIEPKSIGVGQYQHDVDQSELKNALDYTVMSCVNSVGVDVNTASEKLLSYVSGIGPALAANIVEYRSKNGDFKSRTDLKKVPRLGDKAFELAAGFLRVPGSDEILDNTGIHPESYGVVKKMARILGVAVSDMTANQKLLDSIDVRAMAAKRLAGEETLRDIVAELRKPGRDPRTDENHDAFVPAVESFECLAPGMTVPGVVNNITAFGAFIDLGIKENGLIHISKLSHKRVNSVSEVLHIGQKVEAKVIDVDYDRHRISLSLID